MVPKFLVRCASMTACIAIVPLSQAGATDVVLHSFHTTDGDGDGISPAASLIRVNGVMYSTTVYGGANAESENNGTVFSITPAGVESVRYVFNAGSDGGRPAGALTDVNGTLFGTTRIGGTGIGCFSGGCGTVFSVTPLGAESIVYSLKGGGDGDGSYPPAGLLKLNRILYGTTSQGGDNDLGSVFSVTPDGTEDVLYSFKGSDDGSTPMAGLINIRGTLYGTTESGGNSGGAGTVFSITPDGNEKIVYAFNGGNDGAGPIAGLIDVAGTLYGTTSAGGGNGCFGGGCGTVFSIAPDGTEHVVYAFQGGSDGLEPFAGLIFVKGKLYGTTAAGGTGCGAGCGTVFSLTLDGKEEVLHRFGGSTAGDGSHPEAGLLYYKHRLYGTTTDGGTGPCIGSTAPGCGTVFAVPLKR